MSALFGTDGVRGLANDTLTAELAMQLAQAAAVVLPAREASSSPTSQRPTAVVGRDTRISGGFLQAAVVAGLASAGVDVWVADVVPTPAVAYLTAQLEADLGVMISASHNPMPDNGIKFFAAGGAKLPDEVEAAITAQLTQPAPRPTGAAVGQVRPYAQGAAEYVAHVASTVSHSADGLKVVLDCAHGAAFEVGPAALAATGAEVIALNTAPDGLNINADCGSTHLEVLAAAVAEHNADVGFAFDGDADRCLGVAADGTIIDGDRIVAVLALAMQQAGTLPADTVVVTQMSNLGFLHAMREAGVTVRQTAVGDRYVLEELTAGGFGIGGEQSGHVIIPAHATTGDGVLTALQFLDHMVASGKTSTELAGVMTSLPQVLVNVPDVDKTRADTDAVVQAALAEQVAALGDTGRILLRPSGTEPLVRVMVEAATASQAEQVAHGLARVVATQLAL